MSAETIMRQIATELKGNAILRASSSAYSPVGSEGVGGGGSLESRQSEVERARTPQEAAGSSKSTTGGAADTHHKHGRNDQGGIGPMGIEQQQQEEEEEEEMLQTPKRPKKQSGSGSGGGQSSPTIKLDPPSWDTPLGQRSRARSGLEQQHKHPRTDSTDDLFQKDLPPTARVRTGDADNAAAAVGTSDAGVRDQLAVASRNIRYVVTDETAGPPVAAGNETTASSMMASLFLCCSSYEQADSSAAGQQTGSATTPTTTTPGTSLDSNGGATGGNNSKVGEDAALLQRAMRGVNSSRTVSAPRRMGSSMAQSRADSMVALGTATTEEEEEQDEEGVERVVASWADQVDGSNNGASNGAVAVPEKKGRGGGSSSSLRGKLYRSMFKKQQQQTQSSSRASLKDNVTDVPSDGSASDGDASGGSGSHGILSLVNSRAAASIVDSPSDVSDGDGEEGPASSNGGLGGLGLYVTGPALGQFHDVIGSESLSGNRRELGGTYARYRMEQRYVECVLGNMDCVMPLHHHHELTNSDGSMRRSNQWDSTADLGNMAADPIKGCCDNLDMIKGHGTALPENVCSEPAASTMKVRGPTYLADGIKVESDEAMFALLGVDNIFGDGVPHICSKEEGYLGRFRRCCREVGVRVPFLLVINFVLPWGNLSAYMYRPDGTDGGPYCASRSSVPSEGLWKAFLEGNDDYRNQRLKFIPKMIAAPWIVKKMVGSSPALIGQKIPTSYYGSVKDNYLEICLDVTRGPQIANTIATTVAGKSDAVTVDLGFLIEGVVDIVELPEQLLAVFRLHHVYMNVKKAFSEEKWAEEVKRRQRMRSGDDEEETADAEA